MWVVLKCFEGALRFSAGAGHEEAVVAERQILTSTLPVLLQAREPAYRFALLVGVLFASAAAALPLDALKVNDNRGKHGSQGSIKLRILYVDEQTPTGRFSPLRLKGGCGFLGVYGSDPTRMLL